MLFGQTFDAESSTYTYLLAGSSMSLRVWARRTSRRRVPIWSMSSRRYARAR
jgi:hypothetical protein